MKLNLREKSKVEIKRMFIFFPVMMCLTMVDFKQGILAAEEHNADIQVNKLEGKLSIDVVDSSLKSVLKEIGDKAGFKVVGYRFNDIQISKNFKNVPLDQGIRRIMGNIPVVILFQTSQPQENRKNLQGIIAVWVFDSHKRGAASSLIEVDRMQPIKAQDFDLNSEEGFWANRLMDASDRDERLEAIDHLGLIGTDTAVASIAVAFTDKDAGIREHAVRTLAGSKNSLAEQMIGHALFNDKDPFVRHSAVRMLVGRNTAMAYSYLNSALSDTDERVRSAARKGLENK